MNIIAKPIIYGPSGQVLSSGAGFGAAGASYKKRALKAFEAVSGGVPVDIDAHNSTLRQRSRMLYMSGGMATSAIRTNRTNVIGCGLSLKSRLDQAVLGIDAETATRMEKIIEAEFDIWAGNKRHCDATGVNDFYAMQQLILVSWLLSGDAFPLFKYAEPTPMLPYALRIHVIEADRISTPPPRAGKGRPGVSSVDGIPLNHRLGITEGWSEAGNLIHDGVEVDAGGAIVAYHICSEYPANSVEMGKTVTWERVMAYGETTGRPNILQVMDAERPDQYRGVPYLAHVIEPLLQSRRYTESELMAAVVESFFTAFVKTEAPEEVPFNEAGDSVSRDENDYEMGPGIINTMKPGEDITFADPKRPTSGFSTFLRAMAEQVGASLEIPADMLLKAFNSSYSASRAALLEAWKAFKMRRRWFTSDFCQPAYEEWFTEAVARGRIEAPGFFRDPLIRAAWLGAEWIGPTQGQLDPVKEITAKILAIGEGITTREQATVELDGGSWDDNIGQLAIENERLAKANLPLARESPGDDANPLEGDDAPGAFAARNYDVNAVLKEALKESIKEVLEDAQNTED